MSNRLAAGWAAFHKHKGELCNRYYRTSDRVRLFDAVVSPTVLYGSSAWALTQVMEDKLRVTWRKMLRYVFCLHRRSSESCAEDWVDYMQRSAHQVETMARKHGLKDWVATYRRKKFNFAGQVARRTDDRWSKLAIEWLPHGGVGRSRGRPFTRWSDDLVKYAGGDWQNYTKDVAFWTLAGEAYAVKPK